MSRSESLRAIPTRGTTPAAWPSQRRGVCGPGRLRGLSIDKRMPRSRTVDP